MKKTCFIILMSIILLTKVKSLIADNSNTETSSQNFTKTENLALNPVTPAKETIDNKNTGEIDDLDNLSIAGEQAGIKIEAPAPRSFLINCIAKFGIVFFLMPYIKVVNGYRASRDFVIKWATIGWETIAGKSTQQSQPESESQKKQTQNSHKNNPKSKDSNIEPENNAKNTTSTNNS